MSLILHLDCTKLSFSVALSDESTLLQSIESADSNPTKNLNGLINKVLEKNNIKINELKAISINIGPGSYTSLRASLSIAKGLSFALNIPILPIPHDYLLAKSIIDPKPGQTIYTCIIARPNEYLISIFDDQFILIQSEISFNPLQDSFQELILNKDKLVLVGPNLEFIDLQNIDNEIIIKPINLTASDLIVPAWEQYQSMNYVNIIPLSPKYFKDPKITISKKTLT